MSLLKQKDRRLIKLHLYISERALENIELTIGGFTMNNNYNCNQQQCDERSERMQNEENSTTNNMQMIIKDQAMSINSLINDNNQFKVYNNWLMSENAALWNENSKIAAKLEKYYADKDIYDEYLIIKNECIQYVRRKEKDVFTMKEFSDYGIKAAYKITYCKRLGEEEYILIITSNNRVVLFLERDFVPKKVVKLFLLVGFTYNSNFSQTKVGELLCKLISTCIDIEMKNEHHVYETPGWHDSDNSYFRLNRTILKDKLPSAFKYELATTNTNEPITSITKALDIYKAIGDDCTIVVLLAVMLSSLLHSRLKKKGVHFKKILLLSGENVDLEKFASLYLKVFDKSDPIISLDSKRNVLNKSLLATGDSTLVIDGRVDNISAYLPETNLKYLERVCCRSGCINIRDDGNNNCSFDGVLAILDDKISFTINKKYYISVDIERSKLLHRNKDFSRFCLYWGDMVNLFIKYMEKHDIDTVNNNIDFYEIPIRYRDTNNTFNIVLDLFIDFLKLYGIDFQKALDLKYDYKKILSDYFLKQDDDDCNSVTLHFEEVLKSLLNKGVLKAVNDNRLQSNYKDLDNIVFMKSNEIFFTENCMTNVILPNLGLKISTRKLLGYLNAEGILIHNKEGYRAKRSIYLGNTAKLYGFVVLNRDMMKSFESVKINTNVEEAKDNEETKFENWAKLQE